MSTYNFQLEAGDHNVGTVYRPDASGPLPVVIYCHGWASNRALKGSSQSLCDALLKSSAAMVTFDFFGCGETGGPYAQMSYGRWAANLHDVFQWLLTQDWVDPEKVGCFSISSGTTAALRHAEDTREPAFVVSVATCLGLFISMPNSPAKLLAENLEQLAQGGTTDLYGVPFGVDFFKDFLGRAPVYNLPAITCPVFFLQGAADNIWRRSDAWIGYQMMQQYGLQSKYLELADGDHGLNNMAEKSTEEIIKWLKEIKILA